ncbi:MAG: hypothetical protein JWM91_3350 [Rhodospirillales bacterium]|nr:hypothetical protein [Rhodospirillales bacterium]
MASATETTDHDKIRQGVAKRGGRPSRVNAAGHKQGGGIFRIDFDEAGGNDDDSEAISWDNSSRSSTRMNSSFFIKTDGGWRHEPL